MSSLRNRRAPRGSRPSRCRTIGGRSPVASWLETRRRRAGRWGRPTTARTSGPAPRRGGPVPGTGGARAPCSTPATPAGRLDISPPFDRRTYRHASTGAEAHLSTSPALVARRDGRSRWHALTVAWHPWRGSRRSPGPERGRKAREGSPTASSCGPRGVLRSEQPADQKGNSAPQGQRNQRHARRDLMARGSVFECVIISVDPLHGSRPFPDGHAAFRHFCRRLMSLSY